MEFLVDSNVLLDVLTNDPTWEAWSGDRLAECADRGALVINPIIYAEVSVRFDRIEDLEAALADASIERRHVPYEAAFLAGKCFLRYRSRGGRKTTALPDFFIGAHAAVEGWTLLTRDAARFRTYFPRLAVIAPE
jgi:hypothetical protein